MIDAKTRLFALLGHPVQHSMSPQMHNAVFQELGMNCVYLAFDVTDLRAAIAAMKAMGFRGCSVTVPHKQTVMKHLDRVDRLAAKIGAVNTVVPEKGLLVGYNTDAAAAIKSLKAKIDLKGKKVSLVGAGGVGRAIAFALQDEKAITTIFDLDFRRAKSLAAAVGCSYAQLEKLADSKPHVLINATPVGMHPKVNASPVPKSMLKSGLLVFDVVYNPIETMLLNDAKKAGCETISGVEMFVEQGAEQIWLWTGKQAPKGLMREVVLRELAK